MWICKRIISKQVNLWISQLLKNILVLNKLILDEKRYINATNILLLVKVSKLMFFMLFYNTKAIKYYPKGRLTLTPLILLEASFMYFKFHKYALKQNICLLQKSICEPYLGPLNLLVRGDQVEI